MKWMGIALAVTVLAFSTMSSLAGGACCPYSKAKKESAEKMSQCGDALSKLSLNDEQKAKIAEYEAACKSEGCSKASCESYMSKIMDVLSEEQRAEFKSSMEKTAEAAAAPEKTES